MAKKVKFISPVGIAVYPWLTKPDTKFGGEKYKVKVKLDPKDVKKVESAIKALIAEGKYKIKQPQSPLHINDEGEATLAFSSKFIPTIFDARNNKLVDSYNLPNEEELAKVRVGGGSSIRVAAEPFYYDKGLSLQMVSVQVIKLVKGGGSSDFDEIDGYDAFAEAEAEGFGDVDDASDDGDDLDL